MTIRYTVTRLDLARIQLRALLRQPVVMLVAGVIMLLFAGTVASTPELDSRGWPVKLFVAGAAMILFCALFHLVVRMFHLVVHSHLVVGKYLVEQQGESWDRLQSKTSARLLLRIHTMEP